MDIYKFQQRRYKRGDWCVHPSIGLCGCGSRTPPSKKHKTRIVKRALDRSLSEEIEDFQNQRMAEMPGEKPCR